MPLAKILLRKSESPLATAVQRKLPASSILRDALSLTSNEAIRSFPFLIASRRAVFPKSSTMKSALQCWCEKGINYSLRRTEEPVHINEETNLSC